MKLGNFRHAHPHTIGLDGPLRVEVDPCGRIVILTRPFRVRLWGGIITVPSGFKTDFASIPRLFWRLFPPWGRYSEAAVIHDYLCEHWDHVDWAVKALAFLELMERSRVPWIERTIMYWAVRLYGWFK